MRLKNHTNSPKSRLFKFKSHPHGVLGVWHLLKSHYEKWVQKSPEALWHLGFLGWHLFRMHNMVAGVGFEPHDLRVMSPTSYQAALPRDMEFMAARVGFEPRAYCEVVPEAGIEPVRDKISRDFKSRASASSAIPACLQRRAPLQVPIYYNIANRHCQPLFIKTY